MEARDLLAGILGIVTAFLLFGVPCLIGLPLARWLTKRLHAWVGYDPYREPVFLSARAMWLYTQLGLDQDCSRVFSPPGTVGTVGSLAGFVIEPGRGVGPVTFGLSPGQIEALLGRSLGPDDWDDGNLNGSLIYHGLRFSFDRNDVRGPLADSRMSLAMVYRADAVLFGRPLPDWPEHELIGELTARGCRLKEHVPGYAVFASPYLAIEFDEGSVTIEMEAERGG